MAWTKEKSTQYKNEWNAKKYDQVRLNVPKGKREIYKSFAESQGKSLNALIIELLDERISRD